MIIKIFRHENTEQTAILRYELINVLTSIYVYINKYPDRPIDPLAHGGPQEPVNDADDLVVGAHQGDDPPRVPPGSSLLISQ